jgi:hypothetical protein
MPAPKTKPTTIEIDFSSETILAVVAEYEQDFPGMCGWKMPPGEFADRLMAKVKQSARVITGGNS